MSKTEWDLGVGRQVGWPFCVPFLWDIQYSICDPFWQMPIPSSLTAFAYCVDHYNCPNGFGLWPLLAIRQTLSCVGGLLAMCFVHFCLWEMPGLAKWSNCRLFFPDSGTVHQSWVNAVLSPHFMPCFVFFFWPPPIASHSTLKHHPTLSLAQTCKFFLTGRCHLFQEMLLFETRLRTHYRGTEFSSLLLWKVTVRQQHSVKLCPDWMKINTTRNRLQLFHSSPQ